jgi:hypothetical protein
MLIVEHAKSEEKLGLRKKNKGKYYESHHILPRSLFPKWKYRKRNIVLLTAREHFFCHLLLTKIYKTPEMYTAIFLMANDGNHICSSKDYARIRENYIQNRLPNDTNICSEAGKSGSYNLWHSDRASKMREQAKQRITEYNKSVIGRLNASKRQLEHNTTKFATLSKSEDFKDLQKLGRIRKIIKLMKSDGVMINKASYEEYRVKFYNYPLYDKALALLEKLNLDFDKISLL